MDARTVLLVDGDKDSRNIYAMILAHYRYRILEADNGDEGFWLAFTEQPNLIVVELEVTLRDGHRLTERLKREPQTESIPVLVVSSWATATDRRLAQRDGCNAYLPKPCTPSRILQEVQRFIGPSEAQAT